jgi:hypothetical protein
MVISDAEKKILLERLAEARKVKAAKAAAAKKVPAPKKETPQPPAAPIMEPMPAPEEVELVEKLPAETVIALPPKVKREEKQQKREIIDNSSDDESDNEKPVKKSSKSCRKTKETPYMKLKIYREPKNHAALQNLIEAVQDNNDDDDDVNSQEPPPLPRVAAAFEAPRLRHDIKHQTPPASKTLPTHQELMRRAALEFFA